jgi:hypothetical protein
MYFPKLLIVYNPISDHTASWSGVGSNLMATIHAAAMPNPGNFQLCFVMNESDGHDRWI